MIERGDLHSFLGCGENEPSFFSKIVICPGVGDNTLVSNPLCDEESIKESLLLLFSPTEEFWGPYNTLGQQIRYRQLLLH